MRADVEYRELVFKPITYDDIDLIKEMVKTQNTRANDYSVGSIYMWKDYFDYSYTIIEGAFVIKGKAINGEVSFSFPMTKMGRLEVVDIIEEYCHHHDMPFIMSSIPLEFKVYLEKYFTCESYAMTDYFDYVYEIKDLANLEGRRFTGQRNHINQFMKKYPTYQYQTLEVGHKDEVINFLQEASKQVDLKTRFSKHEYSNAIEVIKNYELFDFVGGILRVDGKIVGITFGEIIHDTLIVHVEKAIRSYHGAYAMINKCFAIANKEKVEYINREEDLGILKLRIAKRSYHPVGMIEKYHVEILYYPRLIR